MVQLSHPYRTTGKTITLTRWTFVSKVMSLLFDMLSRLVIAFLPRSKCFLISWLQSPSGVILEPRKLKSLTVATVSLSICHELMGPDAMIFIFWKLSFKPAFSLSSFTFIKRLFSSSLLSAIKVVSSEYLRLLIFLLAILIPPWVSSSPAFHMMWSAFKLISIVTIHSLDVLLSQFGTSRLYTVKDTLNSWSLGYLNMILYGKGCDYIKGLKRKWVSGISASVLNAIICIFTKESQREF